MIDFEKTLTPRILKKRKFLFVYFMCISLSVAVFFHFSPSFYFLIFAFKVHEYETLVHSLIDFQLKGKTKLCS